MSAASAITKGSSKKHSASGNPSEQVPKKAKPTKFSQHCKNKGGPHLTHNTKKCCRYNKDGTPVAVAALKPTDAKKGGDKQIAYLMATIESIIRKGLKKTMKSKKRKRNCTYDSSCSSNFN